MKMVTYKVLSKAMRELTGQVAELDEAIEIRLVFGEKVKITIFDGLGNNGCSAGRRTR